MKTLYLHVGMHKAGSTSIQHALNKDRQTLIEQGVYFPLTATEDNTKAHQNIAWELNKHDRFDRHGGTLADLHEELAREKPENVIMSSEGFTSMDTVSGTARYDRLRDFAESLGYSIVTIGFVREYVACLNSAYTQQVKTLKHARTFADYIADQRDMKRWCYETVFAGWDEISSKVICRANGEDNVKTLYSILGVKKPENVEHARWNTGVGPKTIECSRLVVKAVLKSLESQGRDRIGKLRIHTKRPKGSAAVPHNVIMRQAKQNRWNDELFWGFSPEEAHGVHDGFAEIDREFLRKHQIEFSRDFEKRKKNDFYLDELSGVEREEFLLHVNEVLSRLEFAEIQ